MKLTMDLVQGAELDSEIFSGRITRMAMLSDFDIPSGGISDPTTFIRALKSAGMPQKGDPFPAGVGGALPEGFAAFAAAGGPAGSALKKLMSSSNYGSYFCKRHIVRATNARTILISIIYEFRGIMTLKDSSTLTNVPTQLHSGDFKPLYVTWTPKGGGKPIQKTLTMNSVLPMRHFTVTQTVAHRKSADIVDAFGSVNNAPFYGLPKGYWLFSDLQAESQDDGITYTYSCTASTKQWEDWSQLGFMTDDHGNALNIPAATVAALRKAPYAYGQIAVNGLLKVGNYPTTDFVDIFGLAFM